MRKSFIRFLPERLQNYLLYRWYCPVEAKWQGLFDSADLKFAPGVRMRNLVSTDSMHVHIAFTGTYESSLSRRVCQLSKSAGGVMVDVGANAGYFSLLWAASNPESTCIAFEPVPRNAELFKKNICENGLQRRIELKQVALGRESGESEFDPISDNMTGWGGLVLDKNSRSFKVKVERLDDIIPDHMIINLLKVDTEGADTWVLQGSQKLLQARRIREIRYEQNKFRLQQLGIAENEAADFLHAWGYSATPTSYSIEGVSDWVAVPT